MSPSKSGASSAASTWTIAGCALAYAAPLVINMPTAPELQPDSDSYLEGNGTRTLGYPLFLYFIGADGALVVQPMLATLALAYMGWEMARTLGSAVVTGGTMLAVVGNVYIGRYHYAILTESLFVSFLMVLLGLLARLARDPSIRTMALASLVAGLAAATRPTGLALLPLLMLVALMLWRQPPRRGWGLLTAAVLPMAVVIGGEQIAGAAVHGDHRESLLPLHIFAKSGMIEAPARPHIDDTSEARHQLALYLERDYAPVREMIRGAPSFGARSHLTTWYEVCLAYACAPAPALLRDLGPGVYDRLRLDVALDRIARAPGQYLSLTWLHYRNMWTPYAASHPANVPVLNAYLDANRPLPFQARVPELAQIIAPSRVAVVIQPAVMVIGCATAVLAALGTLAALGRRYLGPSGTLAVGAALAVHGSLVFTALFGVGIPRYMLACWPAMMVALAAAFCWMVSAWGPAPLRRLVLR